MIQWIWVVFVPFTWAQTYQIHYRVGPGDILKVSVLNLEEMNDLYRVDMLGTIQLPYLNELSVRGKTVREIQAVINVKLKEFLNDPQVQVEIKEFNFQPISVIGAVQQPGALENVNLDIDLIRAITQAGGLLQNAGKNIQIIRKSARGMSETLTINRHELLVEGTSFLNIPIFPGDTIHVPVERPLIVSVIGEVNRPGEHQFTRDSDITILRVIAAAGGFTDYARRSKVIVKRSGSGSSEEFRVNVKAIQDNRQPDFVVDHNDVVIVR